MLKPNRLTGAAATFAAFCLLVLPATPAAAAPGDAPAAVSAAPKDAPKDEAATTIDPGAVAALTRMGDFIAGIKQFELIAETTVETVLRGGHQVEIGGVVHYWVKRPDRLRIDAVTDTLHRQFFFDGKSFTAVVPSEAFFARTDAKAGIRETLAFAAQDLDIELPLADLFDWGTPDAPIKHFQRGFYVGPALIGGLRTDHYALIGKDFDFEVWIQQGDVPLPLKISIVDHKVQGSPRFSARLIWSNAPFGDEVFTFTPGKDVAQIPFARRTAAPADKGGK